MPGHPGLPREFKARLKYTRPCLKRVLVCGKATDNPFPMSKIWGYCSEGESRGPVVLPGSWSPMWVSHSLLLPAPALPQLPSPSFVLAFYSPISFGPGVLQPALREAADGAGEWREVAPHAPMRSSAQKSSRCVLLSSVSSPTWIPVPCCMLQRSAGTGALWLDIPPSGRGCYLRTPESVPRCLPLPSSSKSLVLVTLTALVAPSVLMVPPTQG